LKCPACGRVSGFDVRFCATCGFRFKQDDDETESSRKRDVRDQADPLVGRTIADRYRIVELIGRGGMGVVYRVEHTRIAKAMAMKLLHGELARDKEVVRRFRREADAVSKLDHPNTVQVFDFGRAEGMTYLVMELLSGRDLGAALAQEGTIPFMRMAHITTQICASVQQAHEHGIVHRDLKPENVRLIKKREDEDFVKVLDFGLAKLRDNEEHARASITREGFLVGTPYYMAPEHIRGEAVDARSDIYALGALMYKAIVGVPPFWANTPVAVLTKHLNEDPIAPSKRSPRADLPKAADEIVLRCLAKNPADRYQSMSELRAALAEHLAELGIDVDSGRMREPTIESRVSTASGKVVIATRSDVDRYERRLRFASYAQGLGVVLLLALGVVGVVALFEHAGSVHLPGLGESEPNDTPEEATALARGEVFSAFLGRRHDTTHGDTDIYELDSSDVARVVSIEVAPPPNIDVELDVYRVGRPDAILHVDQAPIGRTEHVANFPLDRARYFLRVREVEEGRVFPTENVSDPYTVVWDTHTPAPDEEHELDDDMARANEVAIGDTRTAFIGWSGDRDVFCLSDEAPAAVFEATGEDIDLVLTIHDPVGDREHVVNEPGTSVERWASEGPVPAHTCATITQGSRDRASVDGAYSLRVRAP
jgi:serine/threonine-protein kinase